MANLGNVGLAVSRPFPTSAFSFFGTQNPSGIDITATSAIPGSFALLTRNGVLVERTRSSPSTGVWHFYSGDNSGSQTYTIVTMTQAGGATGEVWVASVVAGVATVTQLFEANRLVAFAKP